MMNKFGFGNYGNYGNNNGSNGGSGSWERTNYAIKESVSNDWKLYSLNGNCIIKPYPVFIEGQPCMDRNPSSFESTEGFDVNSLDGASRGQYISEIIPPAYIYTRMASYVGVTQNHYTFIDSCSDIEQYIPTGAESVKTPYSCLAQTLLKVLPKQNEAPNPAVPPELAKARAEGTLSYSRDTVLFRGMLMQHKGQPLNTKNAVNGTLPKTIFSISQKSAVDAFIRAFMTSRDPMQPLSYTNNTMCNTMPPNGLILSFEKASADRNSDYLCNVKYDMQRNTQLSQAWNAPDEQTYLANLYNSFGACQNFADVFDELTVQGMIDIIKKAYPASWVWYGLRDTPYAPLVQDLKAAAEMDRAMTALFNPTQNTGAPVMPAPTIPANLGFAQVNTGGFNSQPSVPRATMPTLANLPPQQPINQPDAVPMSNFTTPPVKPSNEDQQKADAAKAAIMARLKGGN